MGEVKDRKGRVGLSAAETRHIDGGGPLGPCTVENLGEIKTGDWGSGPVAYECKIIKVKNNGKTKYDWGTPTTPAPDDTSNEGNRE